MKPNSISGITCLVADLDRTAEFYEALGFRTGTSEAGRLTCYVNWFWLTFVADGPAVEGAPPRGEGMSTGVKVENVDEFHQGVLAAGLTPDGAPEKGPSGNREFVLRDPDGYRLVFFQKK